MTNLVLEFLEFTTCSFVYASNTTKLHFRCGLASNLELGSMMHLDECAQPHDKCQLERKKGIEVHMYVPMYMYTDRTAVLHMCTYMYLYNTCMYTYKVQYWYTGTVFP